MPASPTSKVTELRAFVERSQQDKISALVGLSGELTLITSPEHLVELLIFLRDDENCFFQTLVDICAVDFPDQPERFELVYHLLSMRKNQRLRIKLRVNDTTPVPSLVRVYPAANWYEREAFDMYGVLFSDHPDMRRLLTDYGFEGYPLRKDFPLSGRLQVRYDNAEKRVVTEPVKLVQEYRNFDFLSPWEGMQQVIPGDEKAMETESEGNDG